MLEYSRIYCAKVSPKSRETLKFKFGILPITMKIITAIMLASSLALAGNGLAGQGAAQKASLIPGQSLGGIALGPNGLEELKKLGKPFRIDSGMSQTRQIWKWFRPGGRFDTFFVHTVSNGAIDAQPPDGVTIDLIRTTATRFKTADGIAAGSTLGQIRKSFPNAVPVDGTPTVLDDVNSGIAFEFSAAPSSQSACIAVMVHTPGQSNFATQQQVAEVFQNGNTE
jgi:hypothetical protein